MNEFISSDFAVEVLVASDRATLMGAAKGTCTHLLIIDQQGIRQHYVHRHEWAALLEISKKLSTPYVQKEAADGLSLMVNTQSKKAGVIYGDALLEFELNDTKMGRRLLKDVALLSKAKGLLADEREKNAVLIEMFGEEAARVGALLSQTTLECVLFESYIALKNHKGYKNIGLTSIIEYGLHPTHPEYDVLGDIAQYASGCNCGQEHCFGPALLHTLEEFFGEKEKYFQNNVVNTAIIEKQFYHLWENLNILERGMLLLLDDCFENSMMYNLFFLSKDFDLRKYLRLMSYPYQPDSEEEAIVRHVAGIVNYCLSLQPNERNLQTFTRP